MGTDKTHGDGKGTSQWPKAQKLRQRVKKYTRIIFDLRCLCYLPSFRMLHTQYASRRVEDDSGGWQSMRLHTQQNLALILIILFLGGLSALAALAKAFLAKGID